MNSILLYSGGLDSYIGWEYLERPKTVYFALGHRYQNYEIDSIQKTIPETIIDKRLYLGDMEQPDAFIPLRNDILIRLASLYSKKIYLIVQKGELDLTDRSITFFKNIEESLSYLWDSYVVVHSPFFNMTKVQMVEWYVKKGLLVENLLATRSCYSSEDTPCGACSACFRRWVAFTLNGIQEKMKNNILEWEGVKTYIDKMKKGNYDQVRTEETFQALKITGIL